MKKPIKIVLTGGVCSGKTTVIEALKKRFKEKIETIPESATLVFESGFPLPDNKTHLPSWRNNLQTRIFHLQIESEKKALEQISATSRPVILCDRGLLDGVAYFEKGHRQFADFFNVSVQDCFDRYDKIFYLESLAIINPLLYQKIAFVTNRYRKENLKEAILLAEKTRSVWEQHSNFKIIKDRTIQGKIFAISTEIEKIIAKK